MKTINELQDEIVEEFSAFDDWMDKYALLIDLGNSLKPLDEKYKTENNLIEGCQSRVWLQADYKDGKVFFQGESDAEIVKGLVSLLINVLSGHTPDEILNSQLYFCSNHSYYKPATGFHQQMYHLPHVLIRQIPTHP